MSERGAMRRYAVSQEYTFYEIDKVTTMEQVSLSLRCSYNNLCMVYPEDLHWDNCQHAGLGGYGVFEVPVCVANKSYWNDKGPFKYEMAHVVFFGGSIERIHAEAEKWFLANRDLKNELYTHRYGRQFTPVLLPIRGSEPYVPKIKE
ncbi:hypothetical protein D3C85_578210 [compost metagenome]